MENFASVENEIDKSGEKVMKIKRDHLISCSLNFIFAVFTVAVISQICLACSKKKKESKTITVKIVSLDPQFDQLILQNAVLGKIKEGSSGLRGPFGIEKVVICYFLTYLMIRF